jgi:hypothetical protein
VVVDVTRTRIRAATFTRSGKPSTPSEVRDILQPGTVGGAGTGRAGPTTRFSYYYVAVESPFDNVCWHVVTDPVNPSEPTERGCSDVPCVPCVKPRSEINRAGGVLLLGL